MPANRALQVRLFTLLFVSLLMVSAGETGPKVRASIPAQAPPPIVAAFNFTPANPVAGQVVSFTDASTGGPMFWSWIFGDGQSSSAKNPTHAFAAAGTYAVTLTASNVFTSSSVTRNVIVTAGPSAPVADFTFLPANPRPVRLVQFVDASTGSPTSWSWNFGDPGSGLANISTLQSPTHAFPAAGTYRVSLTVANSFARARRSET